MLLFDDFLLILKFFPIRVQCGIQTKLQLCPLIKNTPLFITYTDASTLLPQACFTR